MGWASPDGAGSGGDEGRDEGAGWDGAADWGASADAGGAERGGCGAISDKAANPAAQTNAP
ncbi:MAG: hypothetical protein QM682_11575 [Paracoccus sp. (in: a-proteobacteria)]|uniref:hypothetical protein n=1 Tax=Paracoccus sp. TaxID=267 RepID=UPI0039E3E7CE